MFCVKIVNVDFYMSNPVDGLDVRYSEFRSASVNYVPVIRIFGSSPTGKKTCLHVHGVFPYMYIPFDGSDSASTVSYQVASNLDKALNISLGQTNSNAQHIYKVTLVSGKPLYGYHAKEHQFLKVFFYNPLMIKRACTILQNGNILGKIFQPHETHVPYILQFMIDYNLHGMSFITLSKVLFRLNAQTTVDPTNIDQYLPSNVSKLSICEIEADTTAEHILNRLEIAGGNIGSNPGIACIWEDEKQRRRDKNLDSEISQGVSQTKRKFMTTATHVMFKQTLKLKLSEAPKSNGEFNKDKIDPNASVYPIETPSDESLLNASQVDLRTPNESECSFDTSLNDSYTTNSNENDTTLNDSVLFDTDAKNLLEILCSLREKAEVEEDSILSQLVPKEEDSDSDEELKLSVPLAVTPSKEPENILENVNDLEVKIPQFDGNSDSGANFFTSHDAVRINSLDNVASPAVLHLQIRKQKISKKNPCKRNKNNIPLQNMEAKDTANEEQKINSEINTCQNAPGNLSIKIPQLDGNADSGVFLYENNKKTNIDLDKLTVPPIFPPKIKRQRAKRKHKNDSSSNKFLLAQSELNETVMTALQQKQITRSLAHKFNLAVREHSTVLYNEHKHKKNRVRLELPVVEPVFKAVKRGRDMPDIRSIHDHDEDVQCVNTEDVNEEITVVNNCFFKKRSLKAAKEKIAIVKNCCFKKAKAEKEMVVDVVHPQKRKRVRRKEVPKKIDVVELAKQIKKDRTLRLIKNGLRVQFKLLSAKQPHDYHSKDDNIQISCPSLHYSFTCDTSNPTPYSLQKSQRQKKYNYTSHHSNDNVSKENLRKLNEILKAQEIIERRFWKLAKQYISNSNISGLVILEEAEKEKNNAYQHLHLKENNNIVKNSNEVAYPEVTMKHLQRQEVKISNITHRVLNKTHIQDPISKATGGPLNNYIEDVGNIREGISSASESTIKFTHEKFNMEKSQGKEQKIIKGIDGNPVKKKPYKKNSLKRPIELPVKKRNVSKAATSELLKKKPYKNVGAKKVNKVKKGDVNNASKPLRKLRTIKAANSESPVKKRNVSKAATSELLKKKPYKNVRAKKVDKIKKKDLNIASKPLRKLRTIKTANSESSNKRLCKNMNTKSKMHIKIPKTKQNGKNFASKSLKKPKIVEDVTRKYLKKNDKAVKSKIKRKDINVASKSFKKLKISKAIFGKSQNKITCGKEINEKNAKLASRAFNKVINKQLKCLDGANDSSSSEDEEIEQVDIVLKQAALHKKESLSYRPLTVRVESNKKRLNLEPLDGANDKTSSSKKRASKYKKVTRRLDFESNSLTMVNTEKEIQEEELVCSYKCRTKRASIVSDISNSNKHILSDSRTGEITLPIEDTDTELTSSLSSKELFSSETEDLSAPLETTLCENNVDKYDSELGYKPQPGFSKNITQTTYEPSPDPNTTPDSLTPYQKFNLTQNLTIHTPKLDTQELSSDGLSVWVPQFNPPTKASIKESLAKYNIPEMRHEEPFYSDPTDVKGKIEIGHNVLRIVSKTSVHAPEFQSNFQGIQKQIELNMPSEFLSDRSKNIKAAKAKFFGDDKYVIITPVKQPPTAKNVREWLKNASASATVEKPEKKERQKIYLPSSPTNALDSSNESLSLSPLTPEKIISDDSNEIDQDATITEKTSPILKSKIKKRKSTKRKLSRDSNIAPNNSHAGESLLKTVVNTQFLNQLNSSSDNSGAITGATMNNTFGFKMSLENLQNVKAVMEHQYLTILILELHIQTRGDLKPDPELDPIRAVFYNIVNDVPDADKQIQGIFVVNTLNGQQCAQKQSIIDGTGITCPVTFVNSELDLINDLVKFVHFWNPDIFMGYEIEMLSWGYLIQRGYVLGINLLTQLSRIPSQKPMKTDDQSDPTSELILSGRIIVDMWRLMRHEIALQSYTFESIAFHVLHERVPQYSFKSLSFWWEHNTALNRYKTADYYLYRVKGIARILDQLDLIGRTSELARLFGIQFYEVLSRGSQFRVESMMLRLAKPMNYIPVSPSVQQRAKMRAPEFLPLILEPESKFYADPVIVLDFQSLYPSMMIAYNYCFSTCIGRVEHLSKNVPFEFGATQLKIPKKILKKLLLKNCLNFSPCGVGFVKPSVRPGVLPKMLKEILDTRLMVKKSMKQNSDNKTLYRVLHSRQLGLKLIANVTYGYTAANFSGRMPCVEVADSVVSKGRETLQRAIDLVEKTAEWGARVVYGDTDSLFVLVPGKSREDAFKIGAKIADAVTMDNPSPVKLKLEKVYQPCILQTKKRYVGYMYESPEQKEAAFDAKGIETVRRDGCPAGAKILEKCLKMLFDHCDVSLIRKYVLRQFNKIFLGRISIQELTFAKEYRGASGYRPGACVPALELIKKWKTVDKRNEPRRSERVPYVIVNGPPGVPLIKLVRSPYELLTDPSLRPNALYYITKVIIPPLNRCFMLIGADINTWFNEMPRRQFQSLPVPSPVKKSIISHFFSTTSCIVCTQQTQDGICDNCKKESQTSVVMLQDKLQLWQCHIAEINLICKSCVGQSAVPPCISLDCPVLYRRTKADLDLQQVPYIHQIMNLCFEG